MGVAIKKTNIDIENDELLEREDENQKSISWIANVHDRRQLEIAFDLPLEVLSDGKSHKIEAHFFIPKNINANTSIPKFYRRIVNYQRVHSPLGDINNIEEKIHIHTLDKCLAGSGCDSSLVIQEIKLFACTLDGRLKRTVRTLGKLFKTENINYEEFFSLFKKLGSIKGHLNFFREEYLEKASQIEDEDIIEALSFADEYLSNRFEALVALETFKMDKLNAENFSKLRKELEKMLRIEGEYQADSDYLHMSNDLNEADRNYYFYRQGLLKKFIYDVLYIKQKTKNKEKVYRNIIAMVGAGLAAIWATLFELQRIEMIRGGGNGLNHIPLILIAVFAYMFKDRIKDLSKEFFNSKLSRFMDDYRRSMFYECRDLDGKTTKIDLGWFKEKIFLPKKSELSESVVKLRNYNSHGDYSEPYKREFVFQYIKDFLIWQGDLEKFRYKIDSVKDIWRINISDFLARLDDPSKLLTYFDPETGLESDKAAKVYHVNLVICCYTKKKKRFLNKKVPEKLVSAKRIRLVLNKKGIVRLDKVVELDTQSLELLPKYQSYQS